MDDLGGMQEKNDVFIHCLSKIEKGEYAIYISTKSNISDYGELNELLFRSLDDVILEQDGKKYSFRINKNLRYRIELIVE